jgi:outer membrane protein OmpA-like peptidoglycan-associated protein
MKKIFLFIAIMAFACQLNAQQQVNTQYFIENSPLRHYWNPSFQPQSNFYLSMPVIGYVQAGVSNNSLSLSNIFLNKKDSLGQTINFLHPNGDKEQFCNALDNTTGFFPDLRLNLLGFGFRAGKTNYFNFTLSYRLDGGLSLPKDAFNLVLHGTPKTDGYNTFNLKSLGVNMTAYTEVAAGYSKQFSEKLTFGAKLKFLMGTANFKTDNKNLELNASMEDWHLRGDGNLYIASPMKIKTGEKFSGIKFGAPDNIIDYLRPAGLGGGIDFGATYKPIETLTLSAAINDLGWIFWTKNTANLHYAADYTFAGMGNIRGEDLSVDELFDSIGNAFENASTTETKNGGKYKSATSPKLNIGAEYAFFNNKLSAGVLSRTMFYNGKAYEELTISANARPAQWFNASVSYSLFQGNFQSIGAGLGLRTGPFHWLISADYLGLEYAKYNNVPIPYKTKGFNLGVGLNIVIGNNRDKDKDGVNDRKDKCPDTPEGVIVDKFGCPIDTDKDGVPDYLDKCPNTPQESISTIDENGCPIDTDGDGVPDYLDKCPDTPSEAFGKVDENGCPIDSDGDSVPDYLDKCPNTPQDAYTSIDENGCPKDADGDGVPDYLDKCPNTPIEASGKVDEKGCPLDSDADGVPDYLDKCPNTPQGVPVDENGCPKDTDGDGVPDYLDKCPNTPKEAYNAVDENGCPKDTDNDGIPDYLDQCPRTPGVKENGGCPELKKEIRQLLQKALRGIQFDTNKATIKKVSFPILNEIVKVMNENPTYKLSISGHTDSQGDDATNLALSKARANAVAEYLIANGVNALRLAAEGYGETQPVATNATANGRALNRRVEFVVEFEEVKYE